MIDCPVYRDHEFQTGGNLALRFRDSVIPREHFCDVRRPHEEWRTLDKYGTSLIIYLAFTEYNFIIFEINWLCYVWKRIAFCSIEGTSELYPVYTIHGKVNLLTKKETMRELRSSIPALQAEQKWHG